jgi:hypothetical protein
MGATVALGVVPPVRLAPLAVMKPTGLAASTPANVMSTVKPPVMAVGAAAVAFPEMPIVALPAVVVAFEILTESKNSMVVMAAVLTADN